MEAPGLGAELVGDVVHVHLRVGDAAGAVGLRAVRLGHGGGAGHERDNVGRAVVGGEENGVEGRVGVHSACAGAGVAGVGVGAGERGEGGGAVGVSEQAYPGSGATSGTQ